MHNTPIHKTKHHVKIIIVTVFLILLSFIIYTSVFGGFSFIGKTIMGKSVDLNNSIEISAILDIPSLSLDGEFSQVEIRGAGSFLHVGDGKYSMEASDNYILINDFNGKIDFDGEIISKLKGKASQISVNGVPPLLPGSKETATIYFDEPFNYNFVEISDGVLIRELNYNTFGEIKIGEEKTSINLDDDNLIIRNFQGSLKAEKKLTLGGYIESLDIKGTQRISISSEE